MIHRAKNKSNGNSKSRSSHLPRSVEAAEGVNVGQVEVNDSGPHGHLPIALEASVREASVESLNQILADTMTLRDLYKKHHWQVAGPLFYSLHLLFDKHFEEQSELVDAIAERIRTLGGISVAMAPDVAELTRIPRAPYGRETTQQQIERLLEAHEIILQESHAAAKEADQGGDDGTNDLLVSEVIRTNELQVWFIGQHLAEQPGAEASHDKSAHV